MPRAIPPGASRGRKMTHRYFRPAVSPASCRFDRPGFSELVEQIVARYRESGRFVQGFVRGKLKHDPVYRALLNLDLPLSEGILLDLGCGRGIALATIATACDPDLSRGDPWRSELQLVGIEQRPRDADVARRALGAWAHVRTGDLRSETIPRCRIVLLLDVLLYLRPKEQDSLLLQIADALEPGGILLIREADRSGGWRFQLTQGAERLCACVRGDVQARYHYRSRVVWTSQLETLGFAVDTQPMSRGTPFANLLFVARRPSSS